MKIWYVICIWLCYFSISKLLKENSEIIYKSISQKEPTNYLVCLNLKEIDTLAKKTTVDLQQLNKIVSGYVSNRFNKLKNYFNELKEWEKELFNMESFKKFVLNPIESKDYLILKHKFCFIQENNNGLYFFEYFLPTSVFYLFKNDTYDLFKLNNYYDEVDQLVVKKKEYPYSNCIKNYSKFECLNECFKEKHQLSKYFYTANENKTILLNYEYNKTIRDGEYKCLSKCKRDDCKLVHFVSTGLKSKLSVFKAYFFKSRSEFWIQLFSLICLIENISFYQLLSKLFKFLKPKVKKIKKIKIRKRVIKVKKPEIYLHLLKMAILLISISFFIYYFYEKLENMNNQIIDAKKSEAKTFLLETEKMNLVFCVNANETKKKEGDKYQYYYTYYYDLNLTNMTLLEIETATDSVFNDTIDEIYLRFQNKKIKTNWSLTSKVFFKKIEKYTGIPGKLRINILTRCFQIEANPTEPKYQSLLATSELIVKFKFSTFYLYLLPEEERFNSESYPHSSYRNFLKVIKKRANWIMHRRCADYDKKYSDCNSKQNCIDRCVNKRFIETYKSITMYSIIDKDHFTKDQWSNSFPNNNSDIFNKIKQECEKEFKDDCYEVKFEMDKTIAESFGFKIIQIPLYYIVISEKEEEASLYKLLMDVLTMQSIMFNQNVLKLLLIIYCLLNIKYQLRNNKYYFYFIYLICLAGFIFNTFFIFNQVLHGDLIRFVYYEIENSIETPGIIFCFDFDIQIDQNYKLTENYLNEATRDLRIETVFANITYLNKLNKWITLDSNFTNSELNVKTFYFLNKKCFKIKQDIEYSKDQFYFLDNKEVLKVNFSHKYDNYLKAYFFTKIENKMQFSKIEELIFSKYFAYTSNQEITELTVNDQISWVKNPSLLFDEDSYQNDVNKHLAKLMNKFDENYNLRTLYLPSEKVNSNNEFNDDLFEQYSSQEIKYKSSLNSNIQKLFITTKVNKEYGFNLNKPDFTFELNFIKNKILITNEDNFTKLILNLLNELSLWFSLCILDFHAYVYYAYCKIVFSFNFIYVLLIRIDIYLYRYAYCYT